MTSPKWSLALHGGASNRLTRDALPTAEAEGGKAGLARALAAGEAVLAGGGAALDAVETAVRILEDDPHFDAARGTVFTRDGLVELDAAIMDGASRRSGAVAGLSMVKNPVGLARAVMERSPHVFLAGPGAEAFAREIGVETAGMDWFRIPERWAHFEELQREHGGVFDVGAQYGTVGAVARDVHGHLAAATSTGGLMGKWAGRIGDSPVVGAGTFADDRAGAVSCTGSGEYFLCCGVAREICARMRHGGETPEAAAAAVLADVSEMGGNGGVIILTPSGEPHFAFTSHGMYRARATSEGLREVAVFGQG